jgi:nucleoprotein TPR
MTVQERLLDSAERRAEEGRKRLEEVEREWEEDLERRREAEKRVEEERRDWERAREEYEKKVGELRETVDTLVEANAASGVAGGGGFEEGASLLSPMAGLANSLMRKKGQSISDLYVENVRVKSQLTQAQLEKSRLEDMMSDVLRQIQEKAPALKEQTQAYHKLQDVASQLAAQLATVTHERDSQLSQIASLISQSKTAQSSLSELETHLSDLSRQVIILTREVALRDSPSLAQALERERDGEVENGENDGSMDSVITQNLITFRSIPELQQQNQKLVKIVRELGRKLEAVETNGGRIGGEAQGEGSDEAMKMVDEANELISALKSKLEAKSVQMDKAIRERDMFSRMLSQAGVSLPASLEMDSNGAGGGGVGGSLLDVVKANLDAYRVELGLDGDRLRKELDETRRELGALGGELAKVSAERDWHKREPTFFPNSSRQEPLTLNELLRCLLACRTNRRAQRSARAAKGRVQGRRPAVADPQGRSHARQHRASHGREQADRRRIRCRTSPNGGCQHPSRETLLEGSPTVPQSISVSFASR